MKNKNKKKLIILIISIALVVFIALFFIYYYRESSLLTSSDKNWISENGTEMIDIEVFNDVALYGMNGSGVVFDFLDYVTEETELQFNKIPYSKEEGTSGDTYKIEIIDGSQSLNSNQLFLFEDSYVAVGKKSIKINTIADFAGYTLGVLEQEESNISYYLKSASNITYNSYSTLEELFTGLDENEVRELFPDYEIILISDFDKNKKYFMKNSLFKSKKILLLNDTRRTFHMFYIYPISSRNQVNSDDKDYKVKSLITVYGKKNVRLKHFGLDEFEIVVK